LRFRKSDFICLPVADENGPCALTPSCCRPDGTSGDGGRSETQGPAGGFVGSDGAVSAFGVVGTGGEEGLGDARQWGGALLPCYVADLLGA